MPLFSRQRSRSLTRTSIHPLLLAVLIIAGGLALYYLVQMLFFGNSGDMAEAELNVPSGQTVYVEFADTPEDMKGISSTTLPLIENETVDTRSANGSSLSFTDDSKVLFDRETKVKLEKSRRLDDGARQIELALEEGQVWVEVASSLNPRSEFRIQLGENVFLRTQNGHFAIDTATGLVKVARGTVQIAVEQDGEETFFQEVGVGQQLSFQGDIETNTLAAAESDPWFEAQGEVIATTDDEDTTEDEDETTDDETEETPGTSGTPSTSSKAVQILTPGKNGAKVTIDESRQTITGTVPTGTAKVVVNDYTLQKFSSGDTQFSYVAAMDLGNMKSGNNLYTVEALDASGKVLGEAEITLVYTPDENTEPTVTPSTTPTPITVSGTVQILTPGKNKEIVNISTNSQTITGTVPTGSAKVVVNGYTLQKFTAGSTTFSYVAATQYGNLKSGENVINVQAYDSAGKLIGQAAITLVYTPEEDSEESSAPVSAASTNTTTADEDKTTD